MDSNHNVESKSIIISYDKYTKSGAGLVVPVKRVQSLTKLFTLWKNRMVTKPTKSHGLYVYVKDRLKNATILKNDSELGEIICITNQDKGEMVLYSFWTTLLLFLSSTKHHGSQKIRGSRASTRVNIYISIKIIVAFSFG